MTDFESTMSFSQKIAILMALTVDFNHCRIQKALQKALQKPQFEI
jgi:hypothetical protein